ncbi:hypothetical protein F5888DRAFT_501674 [Russula emetica]|nr:hypothetical protein F5888DRAFT_501674 [Russula emetica]
MTGSNTVSFNARRIMSNSSNALTVGRTSRISAAAHSGPVVSSSVPRTRAPTNVITYSYISRSVYVAPMETFHVRPLPIHRFARVSPSKPPININHLLEICGHKLCQFKSMSRIAPFLDGTAPVSFSNSTRSLPVFNRGVCELLRGHKCPLSPVRTLLFSCSPTVSHPGTAAVPLLTSCLLFTVHFPHLLRLLVRLYHNIFSNLCGL